MQYRRGKITISVERVEGFGKNKGLWIGKDNWMIKVASFGNDWKADQFEKWLEYLVGMNSEEPEVQEWKPE